MHIRASSVVFYYRLSECAPWSRFTCRTLVREGLLGIDFEIHGPTEPRFLLLVILVYHPNDHGRCRLVIMEHLCDCCRSRPDLVLD